MPMKPWFYACKICKGLHPWVFRGDCWDSSTSFSEEDLNAAYGPRGYHSVARWQRNYMEKLGGNLMQDPREWLKAKFGRNLCKYCGWEAQDHTALNAAGNWFAWCDKAPRLRAKKPKNYLKYLWQIVCRALAIFRPR